MVVIHASVVSSIHQSTEHLLYLALMMELQLHQGVPFDSNNQFVIAYYSKSSVACYVHPSNKWI